MVNRERIIFTTEKMQRALELKALDLQWSEVASALGCNEGSLKRAVTSMKKGRFKGVFEKNRDDAKRVIAEVEKGNTKPKGIARALNLEHKKVRYLLYDVCGFDAETLREYRENPTSK